MAVWASGVWGSGVWAPNVWAESAPGTQVWASGVWAPGVWAPGVWSGMDPGGGGPPPIPTDYTFWLSEDNRQRVLLVEAQAYSGGVVVTRNMASYPFVSEPTDTPANTPYDDIVLSTPWFTARLDVATQADGRSLPSWGDVEIDNSNGVRDSWLVDDAWDGRDITYWYGDETWAKVRYQKLMVGTAAGMYAKSQNVLALRLRDKQWKLNGPVQTNLIGGTGANAGEVVPMCFGECYNVEPRLIDPATQTWQVHDGQVQAITAVYDRGVSVAFSADLLAGTFTLAASPQGRITADVQGAKPGGVYLATCADIVKWLAINKSSLTSAEIDTSSFTSFNGLCGQTLGLYIRDRENLLDVLDKLVASVGGWYTFSREGLMVLGRLDSPAGGLQTLDLDEDDLAERQLTCQDRRLPVASIRIAYRKNWTVQADDVAGGVTDARRDELAAPYRITPPAVNAGVSTSHPLAPEPDVIETLIAGESDAVGEAHRRAALYSVPRAVYALEAFATPFSTRVGQIVRLTHRRFGFESGQNAVVVGISENPLESSVKLEIWK